MRPAGCNRHDIGEAGRGRGKAAPDDNCAIGFEREAEVGAGGNVANAVQGRRDIRLAGIVIAPGDDCAIGPEGEAVRFAACDSDDAGSACRDLGLRGIIIAPGDDCAGGTAG